MFNFPEVVADPVKLDRQLRRPPAEKRYCMLFTPRSGSSWVSSIVKQTGRLSEPNEFFNPNFISNIARSFGVANMDDYVAVLSRRKCTHGIFGFQITYFQLQRIFGSERAFLDMFGDSTFFWLIREDIVLQAVSLMKMQQTQIAHHPQADATARAEAEERFVYDEPGLRHWLDHIREIERRTERMIQRHDLSPHRMSYERNVALTAAGVTREMARVLGAGEIPAIEYEEVHQKIATPRNSEFAERFREANPAEVARLEDERAPVLDALRAASRVA